MLLTRNMAEQIRSRWNNRDTQKCLAAEFGVSQALISLIISGAYVFQQEKLEARAAAAVEWIKKAHVIGVPTLAHNLSYELPEAERTLARWLGMWGESLTPEGYVFIKGNRGRASCWMYQGG